MKFYTRFIFHHAHEPDNLRREVYSVHKSKISKYVYLHVAAQPPGWWLAARSPTTACWATRPPWPGSWRRWARGWGELWLVESRSRGLWLVQDPHQLHGPRAAGQAGRLQVRAQGHNRPRGEKTVYTRTNWSNKQLLIKLNSAEARTNGDPLADRRGQHCSPDSGWCRGVESSFGHWANVGLAAGPRAIMKNPAKLMDKRYCVNCKCDGMLF